MTKIYDWQKEELYQFIQEVDALDWWSDKEPDEYQENFELVGLDFNAYACPDKAWGDFIERAV